MAAPEYSIPQSGFHHEITYSKPDLRPAVVTRATSNVFRLYFNEKLDNFGAAKLVLGDTLEFIHNARSGLANFPGTVDRLALATQKDLRLAQAVDGGPTVPEDEEQEALRFALITMGAMPRLATVYFTDSEKVSHEFRFTQRGMLAPPATLAEAAERLRELWRETMGVANEHTDPKIHIIHNQPTLRAMLFFDVGRQIAVA